MSIGAVQSLAEEAMEASLAMVQSLANQPVPSSDPSPGLVGEGLYVGNKFHAADVDLLVALGVTAVLNCAPSMCDDPVAEYEARGWSYAAVDAQDQSSYPLLDQHLPAAREFLSAALDKEGVVFIHCFQGVNRSAALATAFLVEREAAPLLEVAARCFAARPIILRNGGFCKQLVVFAAASGLLR